MTYRPRHRKRADIDPVSGLSMERLRRDSIELDDFEIDWLNDEDQPNPGGFNLTAWATTNDQSCLPENGGLSHQTSMAAHVGVPVATLRKRILPKLKEVGSVHILGDGRLCIAGKAALTVVAAEHEAQRYQAQRAGGLRNRRNLVVGAPMNQSSGSVHSAAGAGHNRFLN